MKNKTSKATRRRSTDPRKRPRIWFLAGVQILVDLHSVDVIERKNKGVRYHLSSGATIQSRHSSAEDARTEFIAALRKLGGLRPLDSRKRA